MKHFGTGSTLQIAQPSERAAQSADLSVELKTIKDALRLSVSELAQLFGVSRPTIYSWQQAKRVREGYAKRIRDIARALAPRLDLLDAQVGRIAHRAIDGRMTLLQKLSEGADAEQATGKLADILQREAAQRERLASRLRGRNTDRGSPDLDALG
jgi:transcriptional regulator with XRE-family HTH domain